MLAFHWRWVMGKVLMEWLILSGYLREWTIYVAGFNLACRAIRNVRQARCERQRDKNKQNKKTKTFPSAKRI